MFAVAPCRLAQSRAITLMQNCGYSQLSKDGPANADGASRGQHASPKVTRLTFRLRQLPDISACDFRPRDQSGTGWSIGHSSTGPPGFLQCPHPPD
jgi:hypothetical protein